MTQNDIIRLVEEAGIEYSKNLNQVVSPYCDGVHMDELEKFINLVAEAEREACAKVAEAWQVGIDDPQYQTDCATAIRARGQG
jgi:hypothetical protein